MKKIQIVTYGGGHANIIRFLVPALSELYDIQILARTVAFKIFDNANILYKKLIQLIFWYYYIILNIIIIHFRTI